MVSVVELGQLELVDLREAWPHEAVNFTPWLAQAENLGMLGLTLGMDLELEGVEQAVESFSADILAREAVSGDKVLIENQLVQTDHSHLGQLLTYAAGLDAKTVVWIARDFRDPHRAAIDHLNRITGPEFNFFGIQIELYRIGTSPYAPRFNVVAKPNDWSKRIMEKAATSSENASYRQEWVDYWTRFFVSVEGSSLKLVNRTAPKEGWCRVTQLRSGSMSGAIWLHWSKTRLRTIVWLGGSEHKAAFDQLATHKLETNALFSTPPTWDRMDFKQSSMIYAQCARDDSLSEAEEFAWFKEQALQLGEVFQPLVTNLKELPSK